MTRNEIEALCAAWKRAVDDWYIDAPMIAGHTVLALHRLFKAGQACAAALRTLAQENEALQRRNDEHVQGWIACAVALLNAGVRDGSVPDGIKTLTDQLAALRADKERLDWLEENDYPGFERWSTGWGLYVHESSTLRDAIDAARAEENAPR